jgi:hypothetical protein
VWCYHPPLILVEQVVVGRTSSSVCTLIRRRLRGSCKKSAASACRRYGFWLWAGCSCHHHHLQRGTFYREGRRKSVHAALSVEKQVNWRFLILSVAVLSARHWQFNPLKHKRRSNEMHLESVCVLQVLHTYYFLLHVSACLHHQGCITKYKRKHACIQYYSV